MILSQLRCVMMMGVATRVCLSIVTSILKVNTLKWGTLLMTLFFIASLSAHANYLRGDYSVNEMAKAWALLEEAHSVKADGRLQDAKALVLKAQKIIPDDQYIYLQGEIRYRYDRYLRKKIKDVSGQREFYAPNALLADINVIEAKYADDVRVKNKRAKPPKLKMIHKVIDETNDGHLQADESFTVLVKVENIGRGMAEDMVLKIHIEGYNEVMVNVDLPDLAPGEYEQRRFNFQLDQDIPQGRFRLVSKVNELDGFNVKAEQRIRFFKFMPPKFEVRRIFKDKHPLIIGTQSKTFYEITNTGNLAMLDFKVTPKTNSAGALNFTDHSAQVLPLIQPGETKELILTADIAHTVMDQTTLSARFNYSIRDFAVTQTDDFTFVPHNWSFASASHREGSVDDDNGPKMLVPSSKTLVICLNTVDAQFETCPVLERDVFAHWLAEGHVYQAWEQQDIGRLTSKLQALRSLIRSEGIEQVILVLGAYVDSYRQEWTVQAPSGKRVDTVLNLVSELHRLPVAHSYLWLENHQARHASFLPVYADELPFAVPERVTLMAATRPGLFNTTTHQKAMGLFSEQIRIELMQSTAVDDANAFIKQYGEHFIAHYPPKLMHLQQPWMISRDTNKAGGFEALGEYE